MKGLNHIEPFLQETIFPDLEKGRPNFDKPHTIAVVKHLKAILENTPDLDLDSDVLVIAAYAHDWGYSGLFRNGQQANFGEIIDQKAKHMIIGAEKTKLLLENSMFDYLSKNQKARIVYLVSVHDKLNDLKAPDELILMEADSLGALDIELTKQTFDKTSNQKYMATVRENRLSKFITNYGKREFERLFKIREDYYKTI